MTHRRILFGYKVKKGEYEIKQKESDIVIMIFEMYVSGRSLAEIARTLSAGKILYGTKAEWNKMCVKRILENEKYKGNGIYPQIISEELFAQAAEIRLYKSKEYGRRKPDIEKDEQPVTATFSILSAGDVQPARTVDEIYSAAQARYAEIKFI